MSRRDLIRMTQEEQAAFLAAPRTAALTTHGSNGYPHTTAMWYAVIDGLVHFATYAKSQKIRNLEVDPRLSVLVDDGDSYETLRGVLIQGDADLVRDPALAGDVMVAMSGRYWGLDVGAAPADALAVVRERGAKRVVIRVRPVHIATWDHAKLAGVY
ncbi:MAG: TIGR03618 family F420-dependent PPOX class oxidoreductase [Acidimicrobiia bacterium]|nr:TIGR03618 family F420-dependent PPOX class oxidoreductase [Acidimicrobiia bacterium]